MCDAKSPPTRKSVIIEINIRQEQYIITIIMNLMLREISILLLLTMASVCRAAASWSKEIPQGSTRMVLTQNKTLFLIGIRPHFDQGSLEILKLDSDGEVIAKYYPSLKEIHNVFDAVEGQDHSFMVITQTLIPNLRLQNSVSLHKIGRDGSEEWYKELSKHQASGQHCVYRIRNGKYIIVGTYYINEVSANLNDINSSNNIVHEPPKEISLYAVCVDSEGIICWEKYYGVSYKQSTTINECIKSTEEEENIAIIITQNTIETVTLTTIDSSGNIASKLLYIGGFLKSTTILKDSVLIMAIDMFGKQFAIKLDSNYNIQWKKQIEFIEGHNGTIDRFIEIMDGHYLGIWSTNTAGGPAMVKYYKNMTMKWSTELPLFNGQIQIREMKRNVFYILSMTTSHRTSTMIKYTLPSYAECLHHAQGEQCKACGLGFYWNYTSCVPCSVGCVECLDIDHCINCSSRYAKTEDNRCIPVEEPCNCDLPNLTPECREKCALPVCSSNSSLPFTYKTDNKKVCTCPDEMLSNETHCLPKTDVGCHPLCDICAGEYCLQCKNITGIFVSRTHSIAVKCQCDYGYQFNSTACIPVKRIHNVQSSESLVAIALGIIGGLVAVGSVAFIMYLKYRRDEWMHGENLPDIQTGKEQHTVEVSKEMEVHAITRDDERTGEIMFKRE
eukprot:TRINITY_DN165_c0_g1_i2.p1 TRINITY_DN165_c0_g1~~TRINITY_DN165_c0_g1_i2.p1  ORF type:complete len:671 (+),score=31.27 TRINITY_DN165_c0_g1_i2:878-2890(+)